MTFPLRRRTLAHVPGTESPVPQALLEVPVQLEISGSDSSCATSAERLLDSLGLGLKSVRLSYESGTEHEALYGARHDTKARSNALNAIARIGSEEAVGAGARQSARAIEDRPIAAPPNIVFKASGPRTGRRIKRDRDAKSDSGRH